MKRSTSCESSESPIGASRRISAAFSVCRDSTSSGVRNVATASSSVVGLAAAYLPARRATRVEVLGVLKEE
jgi:hypothetical protein